jgi:hypothetical protein
MLEKWTNNSLENIPLILGNILSLKKKIINLFRVSND